MTAQYANAPLVEVIAELQWATPQAALFAQMATPNGLTKFPAEWLPSSEPLFTRFGEAVEAHGFRSIERLVSATGPGIPGQASVRYRVKAGVPPLLQIGTGVFTANGLPPTYSTWEDFSPVLERGVEALLSARAEEEQALPFNLSLRYINAFGQEFWSDKGSAAFIGDVLGVRVELPPLITSNKDDTRPASSSAQVMVPIAGGATAGLSVGEGTANGQPAVLMESIYRLDNVSPIAADVKETFDRAHEYLSELFAGMALRMPEKLKEAL